MSTRAALVVTLALAGVLSACTCEGDKKREGVVTGRISGALGAPPTDEPPVPIKLPALPPPSATQADKKNDELGGYACRLMKACYTKHLAFGEVSGRVTVVIGADGKAERAFYNGDTAPGPVRGCVESAGKQIEVTGNSAGAGDLVCDFAGRIEAGGGERLEKTARFVPKK